MFYYTSLPDFIPSSEWQSQTINNFLFFPPLHSFFFSVISVNSFLVLFLHFFSFLPFVLSSLFHSLFISFFSWFFSLLFSFSLFLSLSFFSFFFFFLVNPVFFPPTCSFFLSLLFHSLVKKTLNKIIEI